jgi:hypothetical protein
MEELHLLTVYNINKILNYNFNYIWIMSIECLANDVVMCDMHPKYSTID